MNPKQRQNLLLLGAGICLLVIGFRTFSPGREEMHAGVALQGSGIRGSGLGKDENPTPNTQHPTSETNSSPGMPNEFYARVRKQLQERIPERPNPFERSYKLATPESSRGATLLEPVSSSARDWSLPPLTLQPEIRGASGRQQAAEEAGGREQGAVGENLKSEISNSEPRTPNHEPQTPKFRGLVRDPSTGAMQVALEWNGQIVIATSDPDGEWTILQESDGILVIRHGADEYTVPLSPEIQQSGMRDSGLGKDRSLKPEWERGRGGEKTCGSAEVWTYGGVEVMLGHFPPSPLPSFHTFFHPLVTASRWRRDYI